jgi:hypothetical protein
MTTITNIFKIFLCIYLVYAAGNKLFLAAFA